MAAIIGKSALYGIHQKKPLSGFPDGKVKIRMRNDDFARVNIYVKTTDSVIEYAVKESGEFWEPAFITGINASPVRAGRAR